ncbi:MAG: beta-N-acetylhexosaminidase [Faecousia sp.]
MNIIPQINGMNQNQSSIDSRKMNLCISDQFPPKALSVFLDRTSRLGRKIPVAADGWIRYEKAPHLPREHYRLDIRENGITVYAAGESGANYGLTTLFLLLSQGELPLGTFADGPKYGYRGFSLDVCRHFFDAEEVKRIIEQAALLKLNQFHWHLSDDQGFRVESRKYPMLNRIGSHCLDKEGRDISGFYTWDEIRDIVQFAAERGIEIVPEIDLPGHSRAMQASYAALNCRTEQLEMRTEAGIEDSLICPGREENIAFLEGVLDELCALFPGRYFHIGGDEAPKNSWKNCPHCQRRIREEGLSDEEQLQGWLMNRLAACLREKGKTAICWDDSFASGSIGENVIAQYWNELDRRGFMGRELSGNRKVILSNLHCFYSNYGYGFIPMEVTYSYEPVIPAVETIPEQNILGVECTVWTEEISSPEELEFYLFPRLCAAAEAAWTAERDFPDFRQRLDRYSTILKAYGISFAGNEKAFPKGEKLRKAILKDGLRMNMIGSLEETEMGLTSESRRKVGGWLQNMTGGTYTPEEIHTLLGKR